MATGFSLAGIFILFLGATTNLVVITLAGFLFFCTLPYINTSADVMVRCRIPDELQGRAWGLISILSQVGYVLAYACGGMLADNIFNPMFLEGGLLSDSFGRWIGVGPGRGIGFMLMISGAFVVILGFFIRRVKVIKSMEPEVKTQYDAESNAEGKACKDI
jgi:MFS family permease